MKGLAVPVALHVVLQGTLRNVKRVAVPVILHVVLHGLGFKVQGLPNKTQCLGGFGSTGMASTAFKVEGL